MLENVKKLFNMLSKLVVVISAIGVFGGVGTYVYMDLSTKDALAQSIKENTKRIDLIQAEQREALARNNYLTLKKEFRSFPNDDTLALDVEAAKKDWEYWRVKVNDLKGK